MNDKRGYKQTDVGEIPTEWEFLTVNDIKDNRRKAIISGPFGSNISSKFFVETGIPVIRGNNLTTNLTRFIDKDFVFITDEKANELNTWAIKDDLIFTAAGTLGQVGIIESNSKYEKYIISNKQLRLTVDNNKIRPLFAYYWFSSPKMVKMIEQWNTGSTIPLINLSVLRDLPVVLPPITEQDVILSILSPIDLKITQIEQMNSTLESIGKTIFKHWFIDYDFPDKDGKPYKTNGGEIFYSEEFEKKIPKGWKVEYLGDVLSLLKDGSHNPPKRVESGVKFLAGATDIKHFEVNFDRCSFIEQKDYDKIHKFWRIEPNDVLLTIVGTVGNIALVSKKDLPFSLQRSIAVLRGGPKISYLFLYFALNMKNFKYFLESQINPTAQPGIYLGTLSNFIVCLPPIDLINKFDEIIEPLVKKMQNNIIQRKCLTDIRNSILPKLVLGKIRVKTTEVTP